MSAGIRDRIETGLGRFGRRVYRNAWKTIGLTMLVFGGLVWHMAVVGIQFDTSTESFLKKNDPVRATYDAFRDRFGRDDRMVIAIRAPDVFDRAFLERLRDLHRDIENQVSKLQDVSSLINARNTRGEGDELIVEDLFEVWPETDAELEAIERRARANPLFRDLLIDESGRLTTIMIETDAYSSLGAEGDALEGFDDEVLDDSDGDAPPAFITGDENSEIVRAVLSLMKRYDAPDFRLYGAGTPMMVHVLQDTMRRDMQRFTGLGILSIAVFLGILFRRAAGVVLPLVTVILAVISTLAIMTLSGTALTLGTQILPSFLLAVGVSNSVHLLVVFFQRRRRGDDKEEAVAYALAHSGLAVVMTSLTTAGGLLSFSVAELAPIAHLGIFGPTGVMVTLAYTIVLLPALIAVFPMREEPTVSAVAPTLSQRLLVRTGSFATRHAGAVALASAGIVGAALLGALQLRFAHDPIKWFPEDDPFRIANDLINDELGGSMFLEVLIDTGEENGLHDPDVLQRMDQIRRTMAGIQIRDVFVGKTMSVVEVVKEIHQALNENRPGYYAIPDSRPLVAQELLLFENSGSDDLEDVVDPSFQVGRMTMKIPFIDSVQYGPFLTRLDSEITEILGDRAEFTVTGLAAVVGRTFNAVIFSMAKTYLVALLVITPLMVLLIGNIRIGLLSMVPNLGPILITLGVMGWFDMPLDAFTLLIGSIAIGLAVDDTIHFMHNFRRYYERSGDVEQSVADTLSSTGQALLFTSLVLATAFFIFMLADMNNLFAFGLLTGLTIIVAFLADVILAPALMALVIRGRSPAVAAGELEVSS